MKILKKFFSICILTTILFLSACGDDSSLPLTLAPDFYPTDASLEINVIDTGYSDSIFIEIADYTIIIDSGFEESENTILDFIIYNEMNKIDYLIMTHPTDNYLDRLNILENYTDIGRIFHPNFVHNFSDDEDDNHISNDHGIILLHAEEEFTIRINGLTLTIYPTRKEGNYSLIASLQYSNQLLLFAGDATIDYLNEFLLKNESQYTILKIPHQGIYIDILEEFLYAINPTHGILTSNGDAYPSVELLQTLAKNGIQTFLTCDGMVTIKISDNSLNVTQQLNKFSFM